MNLVTLKDISIEHGDRQLMAGIDLLINTGDRVGLIGINGSGKSSLLGVVAGENQPDSGRVIIWGGVRISYLPQEPQVQGEQTALNYLYAGDSPQLKLLREYRASCDLLLAEPDNLQWQEMMTKLADEMDRSNGWAAEAEALAILTRLGITDPNAPLDTLSGGQGKRVALARTLIEPADLLILDEPTNHIDVDAIDWLENYLKEIPRALLMVTHDRYFLDRVVNRILELDRRKLVAYPGNYQRYLELRSQRHDRLAAAEKKQQQFLKRELEWLRRSPMARGTKQKARKTRIEELRLIRHDLEQDTISIALASQRLGKKVLEAKNLSKSFGNSPLFGNLDFSLTPGERLGIVGPNGAGKSTFLDILAGNTQTDSGFVDWGESVELGYYDQLSRDLELDKRVIDFINEKAPLIQTSDGRRIDAARMLEWFLFSRPQQRTYIGSLSGGERRRLYLLWVLIHQPNVLFLDEPTNDLDIPTLRVLEQFLDHFKGSLVVVSHDRFFLDRNVEQLALFSEGGLDGPYAGPYKHFQVLVAAGSSRELAKRQPDKISKQSKGVRGSKKPDSVQPAMVTKLSWNEERELEQLEREIEALESDKARLEEEINQAGGSYDRLRTLAEEFKEVNNRLQLIMERWLELAEVGLTTDP